MGQDKLTRHLLDCAITCNMCYNACLNEEDVTMMVRCIELDRECSDICSLTATILARDSENKERYLMICADICDACAEECSKHDHEHCRKCAEECKSCAKGCRELAAA